MKKIAVAPAISVALVLLGGAFCQADKVTVDPNLAPKTPAAPVVTDSRLAQSVTYTSGGKRLHTVLNDLATITGVTLSCGSSNTEWQIRDLPVAVCVKDIELGKLLQYIADCTHLTFKSSKSDKGWVHKLVRAAENKMVFEEYVKSKQSTRIAEATYQWDVWNELGKMPDEALRKKCEELANSDSGADRRATYTNIREFSKMVATLGPENKKRLLAGDEIIITLKDPSAELAASLRTLYVAMQEERFADLEKTQQSGGIPVRRQSALTDDELGEVSLTISMCMRESEPVLTTTLEGSDGKNMCACVLPSQWLKPQAENPFDSSRSTWTPWSDSLRLLEESEEDSGDFEHLPVLQVKLTIPKFDPLSPATLVDAMSDISNATGFSMICENFPSDAVVWGESTTATEITLGQALQKLSINAGLAWWLDEKQKLLVGFADRWCDHHINLVPESLIVSLTDKLDTDGAELNDALPVTRLTEGQLAEWFSTSKDLRNLFWILSGSDKPLWQLYDSLSAQDKALAASADGLALSKFDPNYLSDVFQRCMRATKPSDISRARSILISAHPEIQSEMQEKFFVMHPELRDMRSIDPSQIDRKKIAEDLQKLDKEAIERLPELKTVQKLPTDPESIAKLVLRVKKSELAPQLRTIDPKTGTVYLQRGRGGIARHAYCLTIQGDNYSYYTAASRPAYPVYSLAREKKLLEEKKKPAK